MSSLKTAGAVGALFATLACACAAEAADLGPAPLPPAFAPAPLPIPVPVPVGEIGGFYLRSYIGVSDQSVDRLSNSLDATITKIDYGFAGSPHFGFGAGYKFGSWFRADVTGEYRSPAAFTGLERYRDTTLVTGYGSDEYTARKRDGLVLVNGYVDLGTWYGITPYMGAGVGTAVTTIDNYRDTNVVTSGVAYAKSATTTSFAWALHAGVGFAVTPNLTVEAAYSYKNLGNAKSGVVRTYLNTCGSCEAVTFRNVQSHDVMVGLRWFPAFPIFAPAPLAVYPEAPLVRKY